MKQLVNTPEDDPVIAAGDELLLLVPTLAPVEIHLADLSLVASEDGELCGILTSEVCAALPQHSSIGACGHQVPEIPLRFENFYDVSSS